MLANFLGHAPNPLPELSSPLPLFTETVSAGFPSPAQDYEEQPLDLNELCIARPNATYFVRALGDSMIQAGIQPGDLLVVDRSMQPGHGDIVIAGFHGELTVKRLELTPSPRLVACNPAYPPIAVPEGTELYIQGVVMHIIRSLRKTAVHNP